MPNVKRAAVIMIVLAAFQAWPLVINFGGPNGLAALIRVLGFGGVSIPPLAWLAAAAIAIGYAYASMKSLPSIREKALTLHWIKLLGIVFAFVTGIFEEFYFRKWLMNLLQHNGQGVLVQIIGSGIIFGVAHAIWGLFGGNLRVATTSMIFTTLLGLALAWLYIFAGRQVGPSVWSHILINLIIEPWLLLAVLSLRKAKVV